VEEVAAAVTATVLIIDDEPAVLGALRRTLRRDGHRILTTTDPEEVFALLDREHIDVLISDIDMPGMSGVDLVARARRAFPDVVRILLTGRGSLDTALRAINDGEVYRYLTKPWDDADLRQTIVLAIERQAELKRAAQAERRAEQRRQLLSELEGAHPGISKVVFDGDVYVIDEPRLDEVRKGVPGELAGLLGPG
jgi:DNA-binding NtrC family response regulator